MLGRYGFTKRGEVSQHAQSAVGPRQHLVVEFDFALKSRDGLHDTDLAPLIRRLAAYDIKVADMCSALLTHLARFAPLALVVYSGGKSLHGWFPCAGTPEDELRDFMHYACQLGADSKTWTSSQFVRMPDGVRRDTARNHAGNTSAFGIRRRFPMLKAASKWSIGAIAQEKAAKKRASWSALGLPTEEEITKVAELLGFVPEAMQIAASRGLLFSATCRDGHRSFVVADFRRLSAVAFRLDGLPWERTNRISRTLPGSVEGWPLGIGESEHFPAIALVCGGLDLLAALHLHGAPPSRTSLPRSPSYRPIPALPTLPQTPSPSSRARRSASSRTPIRQEDRWAACGGDNSSRKESNQRHMV